MSDNVFRMPFGYWLCTLLVAVPAPRAAGRGPRGRATRIKPYVKSPKSGILVTEVITFDKIAPWVILGRS